MWRAKARAVSLALALGSASAAAHAACTKDNECAGELICEAGQCTEPSPPPAASAPPLAAAAPVPRALPAAGGGVGSTALAAPRASSAATSTAPSQPGLEQRSPLLVGLGALATLSGLVGLTVGVATSGTTCYFDLADDFRAQHCERSTNVAAYVIGGLLFVGGIPLMIVGHQRVPVKTEARLAPWVSPRGGGLLLKLTL